MLDEVEFFGKFFECLNRFKILDETNNNWFYFVLQELRNGCQTEGGDRSDIEEDRSDSDADEGHLSSADGHRKRKHVKEEKYLSEDLDSESRAVQHLQQQQQHLKCDPSQFSVPGIVVDTLCHRYTTCM